MPIMRATFVYEDDNKHGWTETYYNSAATTPEQLLPTAKKLAPLRAALLGDTARLAWIRVSDDLVKRDSLLYSVPYLDGTGHDYGDIPSESANYAVKVRLDTLDPTKRGMLYLSGVPDDYTTDAGKFRPSGRWQINFTAFKAELVKMQWAVKNKSGTVPVRMITAAVQNMTTGNITITTAVAHGFAQGDGVVIRGTGVKALTGTFTALAGTVDSTLIVHINQIYPGFLGLGNVSKIDFALYGINGAQWIGPTHRNRGRFLDSPVGRRKARAKR